MKTTIDIPDALMAQCKRLAKDQGITFRNLVEEGLVKVLEERSHREPFRLRTVPTGGGGFQPGIAEDDWAQIRATSYEGRGT